MIADHDAEGTHADGPVGKDDPRARIAAVVVHHNSYETVRATVSCFRRDGLSASEIVVVDNSEGDESFLEAVVAGQATCLFIGNRGYGNAVNVGVSYVSETLPSIEFIAVATHEVLFEQGTLSALLTAMSSNSRLGAVGPMLVSDSRVWSKGGVFSKFTHLPVHRGYRENYVAGKAHGILNCDWLDGAFVLYRFDAIVDERIREDYFLYLEEVEYHLRLKHSGWSVACALECEVEQSSNGVPAYYAVRNLQLLNTDAKVGSAIGFWRILVEVLRRLRRFVISGCRVPEDSPGVILRGLRDGRNALRSRRSEFSVTVVNPLGAALQHYSASLVAHLTRSGAKVSAVEFLEPSATDYGSLQWVIRYFSALMDVRRSRPDHVLVVWPVLGFLDLLVLGLTVGNRSTLIIHDPVPLSSRTVGYGRLSRGFARIFSRSALLVHGSDAYVDVRHRFFFSAEIVDHPVGARDSSRFLERAKCESGEPLVLVFGQYKMDRDLALLKGIASSLPRQYRLRIHGRGWPKVPGWEVVDEFVPEEDVDGLLRSASVVLIPYKRFYQSGVAVRCLELGVPFLGDDGSWLSELLPADANYLVSGSVDEWSKAIQRMSFDPIGGPSIWERCVERADSQWSDWVRRKQVDR